MAQRQYGSKQSKGKKNRKHGRQKNKPAYKRYLAMNMREKHKQARILRRELKLQRLKEKREASL